MIHVYASIEYLWHVREKDMIIYAIIAYGAM